MSVKSFAKQTMVVVTGVMFAGAILKYGAGIGVFDAVHEGFDR